MVTIAKTPTDKLSNSMVAQETPINVTFYGKTTSTSQTEIFVDNRSNFRIAPPENCNGFVEFVVLGYNETDDTATTPAKTRVQFSRIGTTTAGTQVTDVTNVYDDTLLQVAADDTNDYLTVSITAADTDTYAWKVYATIYTQGTKQVTSSGDFDNTPKG